MARVRIRYTGIADERILPKKDLNKRGVAVDTDLVFNRQNLFAVNIDATDTLLEIVRAEGTFKVDEIKEENAEVIQNLVVATQVDDTAPTVVDGNTGQRSTRR